MSGRRDGPRPWLSWRHVHSTILSNSPPRNYITPQDGRWLFLGRQQPRWVLRPRLAEDMCCALVPTASHRKTAGVFVAGRAPAQGASPAEAPASGTCRVPRPGARVWCLLMWVECAPPSVTVMNPRVGMLDPHQSQLVVTRAASPRRSSFEGRDGTVGPACTRPGPPRASTAAFAAPRSPAVHE